MNLDINVSRVGAACAQPIRVLLADDHAITLWGLGRLVESAAPRMAVSGTAATVEELLAHPALHDTDVVLLDLSLGHACALDCLPQLISEGVKVVVLTGDLNALTIAMRSCAVRAAWYSSRNRPMRCSKRWSACIRARFASPAR